MEGYKCVMPDKRSMKEIDVKYVEEDGRSFSVNSAQLILQQESSLDNSIRLELSHFIIEDLKWLISLDSHKFWSYFTYSEEACMLVASVLRGFHPSSTRKFNSASVELKEALNEIEYLVFLIFYRMSADRSLNLTQFLDNSKLLTIPVLLDFCSMYGCANSRATKNILNVFFKLAPKLVNEFKEMVPNFFDILRLLEDKFVMEDKPRVIGGSNLTIDSIKSLVHLLNDAAVAIEMFLTLYPKCCTFFCTQECISGIASFYTNVLPEMQATVEKQQSAKVHSSLITAIDHIRVDLLKIVHNAFCYLHVEAQNSVRNREEVVDEYLTLAMELLSESVFLRDYTRFFHVSDEIESVTGGCSHVDTIKKDHILHGLQLSGRKTDATGSNENVRKFPDVRLLSLMTEVKDILPHLNEDYILECLKCYNYDTEKVIAVALENYHGNNPEEPEEPAKPAATKKKLDRVKEEWKDMEEKVDKQKYAQWLFVEDATYEDEYDDTYDEEEAATGVVREDEDADRSRRPFVTPRVLEGPHEEDAEDAEEATSEDEEPEDNAGRRKRGEFGGKNVVGRPRGRGQTKQVERNRAYKEAHKSHVANHDRKRQAERKRWSGGSFRMGN